MGELTSIPVEEGTKDFVDLRDRAAYVYATGSFPTHLRSPMMALLNKVARYTRGAASVGGAQGSIEIAKRNVELLGLNEHPMVAEVRIRASKGYRVHVARDLKARRPFGKVFMAGPGGDRITVQSDGSVLNRW
jgi:hypothetical protein